MSSRFVCQPIPIPTRSAAAALLLLAALGAGVTRPDVAVASYREPCRVRYQVEYGWSQTYDVHCVYATGAELNSATSSFRYQVFSTYAVVFWDKGEASVILMNGFIPCGSEAADG